MKEASQSWALRLSKYREQNNRRAVSEIAITAVPFAALWAAAWLAGSVSFWLALLLALAAAGFLVRLFMIQHDCGHGALFTRRPANDWAGRALGVFTLTPYDVWRSSHNQHHAGSGNLDHRGIGDITTLTVREYQALSRWKRFKYRAYRHPLVMFGIGPVFLFVVQHRVPGRSERAKKSAWVSTMATNAVDRVRHRRARRRHRTWAVSRGAAAHHHFRRNDRGVAVLCAASVRSYVLGKAAAMDATVGGAVWKLVPPLAEALELAYRQYRLSSYPSFIEPHSVLPAAERAEGVAGAQGGAAPHASRKACARSISRYGTRTPSGSCRSGSLRPKPSRPSGGKPAGGAR